MPWNKTQISHLSQSLREVRASSLLFTVYTRDHENGRIVELLNTGMVGMRVFSAPHAPHPPSSADAPSEGGATRPDLTLGRVVLDFEEDVRQRRLFAHVFSPRIRIHYTCLHLLETAAFGVACLVLFVLLFMLDDHVHRAGGGRGG